LITVSQRYVGLYSVPCQ